MKRLFILPLLMMLAASCTTLSPTAQSIARSGQKVDRALHTSYEMLYSEPTEIQTRFNPCACDPALEFEANLYGHWRHVMIRGSDKAMTELRERVRNLEMHQVFDVSYQFSNEYYTSTTGQRYYTLYLPDEE